MHIQKEPPFWDIFPEDGQIFSISGGKRALKHYSQLHRIKPKGEKVIRYSKQTVIGQQNVDLASSWEEVTQVLEVKACRQDREEIQRQVNHKFQQAENPPQKQRLYQHLITYLEQRALELDQQGGKDTPEYKREANIIQNVIKKFKINVNNG